MQIHRDYSQPFFGSRRRRRGVGRRWLLVLLALIAVLGFAAYSQRDALQLAVLSAMNMAPTPTPGPTELVSQARAMRAQGDLSRAAALYEQALAARPDDIDWLYEYGLLQMDLENYAAAVDLGQRAIDIDSFDPRGYALKARGYVWQGDGAAAIPVALSGLNVDGRFAPLHAMLGRAYTLSGNLRAGIDSAEAGVAIDPGNAEARRALAFALNYAASYDAATEELETALSLEPGNVSIAMELAFQYLALNRDEDAIDLYNTVLKLQPRNSRAMLRLCRAYRKVGQFDEALTQCENAVRADPSYVSAQFQLGLLRYSEPYREFTAAAENFSTCVSFDPSNVECLFRWGLTDYYRYLADGDTALCGTAWDKLNQSLQMADGRPNLEQTIADIQLGMEHVARDCPGNLAAQMPLNLTPVLLVTPTGDPLLTVTPEPGA
ncbi:MAG: hypothetical protein DWB44_12750 [Chloroflexi bacterium]|nr:hypothetical protein [Chloroflexota bacterium]MDL1917096.1 tetratricopeptide repeat protein [Anaerolineae bacterium CFX4]